MVLDSWVDCIHSTKTVCRKRNQHFPVPVYTETDPKDVVYIYIYLYIYLYICININILYKYVYIYLNIMNTYIYINYTYTFIYMYILYTIIHISTRSSKPPPAETTSLTSQTWHPKAWKVPKPQKSCPSATTLKGTLNVPCFLTSPLPKKKTHPKPLSKG